MGKKESLFVAIRKGNHEKVAKILDEAGPEDGIHPDLEADSAMNCILHRAARYGHYEVVKVSKKSLTTALIDS